MLQGGIGVVLEKGQRRATRRNVPVEDFWHILRECTELILPDLDIIRKFPAGSADRDQFFRIAMRGRIQTLSITSVFGDRLDRLRALLDGLPPQMEKSLTIKKGMLDEGPLPDFSKLHEIEINDHLTIAQLRQLLDHKELRKIRCFISEEVDQFPLQPYVEEWKNNLRTIHKWDLWFKGEVEFNLTDPRFLAERGEDGSFRLQMQVFNIANWTQFFGKHVYKSRRISSESDDEEIDVTTVTPPPAAYDLIPSSDDDESEAGDEPMEEEKDKENAVLQPNKRERKSRNVSGVTAINLQLHFARNPNPSKAEIQRISQEEHVSESRIARWFCTKRDSLKKRIEKAEYFKTAISVIEWKESEYKGIRRTNNGLAEEHWEPLFKMFLSNPMPTNEEIQETAENLGIDIKKVKRFFKSKRSLLMNKVEKRRTLMSHNQTEEKILPKCPSKPNHSKADVQVLEAYFANSNSIKKEDFEGLVKKTQLTKKQVRRWFRTKRSRVTKQSQVPEVEKSDNEKSESSSQN